MTPVVEARGLTRHFAAGGGLLSRRRGAVRAIDGVSFAIDPGRTLGLDGESGCGKTTTARPVLLLDQPSGGMISFDGEDLQGLDALSYAAIGARSRRSSRTRTRR